MKVHALGMFYHPDREWQEIRNEHESVAHMYASHALILAAIPPVSAFIGTTMVGWSVGMGEVVRLTAGSAMMMAILSYVAMLTGIAVMGAFIHWMSRTYDASPTLQECVVFAAYCATPLFFAGISAIYPSLMLTMLVGTAALAYTTYLLYVGVPTFMNIPRDEGFMFSSSILAVGLVVLVAMLAASVALWGFGIGPVYTS